MSPVDIFPIGSKVRCIYADISNLIMNEIYTVENIVLFPIGGWIIFLKEIKNNINEGFYMISRFEPVATVDYMAITRSVI